MSSFISGFLSDDSPLRRAFPGGIVPLARPDIVPVLLADEKEPTPCYMLAVLGCNVTQKRVMARIMADLGQGTLEDCENFLNKEISIPIRTKNITGCGMPVSMFI